MHRWATTITCKGITEAFINRPIAVLQRWKFLVHISLCNTMTVQDLPIFNTHTQWHCRCKYKIGAIHESGLVTEKYTPRHCRLRTAQNIIKILILFWSYVTPLAICVTFYPILTPPRPILPSRYAYISPPFLLTHTLWLIWSQSLLTTCSFHPCAQVVSGVILPCGCNSK